MTNLTGCGQHGSAGPAIREALNQGRSPRARAPDGPAVGMRGRGAASGTGFRVTSRERVVGSHRGGAVGVDYRSFERIIGASSGLSEIRADYRRFEWIIGDSSGLSEIRRGGDVATPTRAAPRDATRTRGRDEGNQEEDEREMAEGRRSLGERCGMIVARLGDETKDATRPTRTRDAAEGHPDVAAECHRGCATRSIQPDRRGR